MTVPRSLRSPAGIELSGRFGMVGTHPSMLRLFQRIERLAPSELPTLVIGETGTGKECVARAIHDASARRGRYVAINVAALSESLIETELFGSARGAYTGAESRPGLIESAQGGTLVLDEAADISGSVQVKLLRALESGYVRRVGATDERAVSFRLIVTSQLHPDDLLRNRRWRSDFYYRAAGTVVALPSLRERRSDVPLLAAHFAERIGHPGPIDRFLPLALYHWPGNVRQLRHVLEQAFMESDDPETAVQHAMAAVSSCEADRAAPSARRLTIREVVDRHVEQVVAACPGDTGHAAGILGVSRSQLYRLLQRVSEAGHSRLCDSDSHRCECDAPDHRLPETQVTGP